MSAHEFMCDLGVWWIFIEVINSGGLMQFGRQESESGIIEKVDSPSQS